MSSIIDSYLKDSYTWQHIIAVDKYDEPSTTITTTIRGRMEKGTKLIESTTLGNPHIGETVSASTLITTAEIVVGDRIDGRMVLAVNRMDNLDGTTEFYEVALI